MVQKLEAPCGKVRAKGKRQRGQVWAFREFGGYLEVKRKADGGRGSYNAITGIYRERGFLSFALCFD